MLGSNSNVVQLLLLLLFVFFCIDYIYTYFSESPHVSQVVALCRQVDSNRNLKNRRLSMLPTATRRECQSKGEHLSSLFRFVFYTTHTRFSRFLVFQRQGGFLTAVSPCGVYNIHVIFFTIIRIQNRKGKRRLSSCVRLECADGRDALLLVCIFPCHAPERYRFFEVEC